MNEKQIKIYLGGLYFGLKDKNKTTEKWFNNRQKFNKEIVKYELDFSNYLDWLEDNIKQKINENQFSFYLDLDLRQKSNIRMFKTYINGITRDLNYNFLKNYAKNNYQALGFTINFYLAKYEEINNIMKEVLNDYVLEYPKRAVCKKLGV